MTFWAKPFKNTIPIETLKEKVHPGDLIELIDPDGGPSNFYWMDRSGHLHQVPSDLAF